MKPNNISSQDIAQLRASSRKLVREWGFMRKYCFDTQVSHQHTHALIEIKTHHSLTINRLANLLRLKQSSTSRLVEQMVKKKYITIRKNPHDKREKQITLTTRGLSELNHLNQLSDQLVAQTLNRLNQKERECVFRGMTLYTEALSQARFLNECVVRKIEPQDNQQMAQIIRSTLAEFGATGEGYAFSDPSVDHMYEAYQEKGSCYYVVDSSGKIYGGAGLAPLKGNQDTCELQKMYLSNDIRGLGFGQKLIDLNLDYARKAKYKKCYLETLTHMKQARRLYEKNGFKQLKKSLGETGHHKCNQWYLKKLL